MPTSAQDQDTSGVKPRKPSSDPHKTQVNENERNDTRRDRGRAGEGFEDERDEYKQTGFGQAGYRDAKKTQDGPSRGASERRGK